MAFIDEIANNHNYGGHLANILNHYGVEDEAVMAKAFDWWKNEGAGLYVRIKAKHKGDKDATFKESGALVKTKLIEFGAKIKK